MSDTDPIRIRDVIAPYLPDGHGPGKFTTLETTGDVTSGGSLVATTFIDTPQLINPLGPIVIQGVTILNAEWNYLSTMNQNVSTTSTPTFFGLDAGGQKIVNLATPTASTDAANKAYVDSIVDSGDITNVSGTAGQITVVNGTTAPVISIDPTYIGQASITTLGTISSGTWQGTTIAAIRGGTGLITYTAGDLLYSSASNVLSKLGIGTAGQILNVSGGFPTWSGLVAGNGITISGLNISVNASGDFSFPAGVLSLPAALSSLGSLVTIADQIPITTAPDTYTTINAGAIGKLLIPETTAAGGRTTLQAVQQSVVPGTLDTLTRWAGATQLKESSVGLSDGGDLSNVTTIITTGKITGGSNIQATTFIDTLQVTNSLGAAVDLDSKRISSLALPSAGTDAANKNYVLSVAGSGITVHAGCRVATTADLGLTYVANSPSAFNDQFTGTGATPSIDVVSLNDGDRILVKNQATTFQNGIYQFVSGTTSYDRVTDWDRNSEPIPANSLMFISEGTTNANTQWTLDTAVTIVGTDPATFTQFGAATSYTGGNGITVSGNVISVNNTSDFTYSVGQLALSTVSIAKGGTGQTTATTAFNALSPLTTKGDVVVRDNTANNVRLPVGTDGQVLSSNSASTYGLSWITPTNGTVTSVTGTAGQISIINNTTTPVVSIDPTYVGQASITTLGTITSGVWTGTVVAAIYGGTGQVTYTTGDLLYASSSTTLSNLADVAAGSYLLSGGVGLSPLWSTLTLPNSSTTGDLLYSSASNAISTLADVAVGNALISGGVGVAPSWGKISLTTTVSGILPIANGGTNLTTYTTGDLVYASAANTLNKLADVATGNALISGGVGVAPSYGKIDLTTTVSGTLPIANGGTNLTTYTTGDIVYASAANTLSKLADVAVGSYLRSGGVTTAPLWSTLTLPNSSTTGDLLYSSASSVISTLADVATGNALISGGVGVAPSWGKISLTTAVSGTLPIANGGTNLTTYTTGDLVYASATNTLNKLADVATGNALISGGVGVAPSWGQISLTTTVSGILPSGNGGTNNAFFAVSGPATSIKTYTFANASDTVALLGQTQTFTGVQSFNSSSLLLKGATSGTTTLNATAVASGTVTIPAGTDTLMTLTATQSPTNKTFTGSTNTIAASQFRTSSASPANDVVITSTTPSGANQALITTSATAATWQTVSTSSVSAQTLTLSSDFTTSVVPINTTQTFDVTGLNTFSLAASSTYRFIFWSTGSNTNGSWGLTVNASGAISSISWWLDSSAGSVGLVHFTALGSSSTASIGGSFHRNDIHGIITTTGAVTFKLQVIATSGPSNSSSSTVNAGTYGTVQLA